MSINGVFIVRRGQRNCSTRATTVTSKHGVNVSSRASCPRSCCTGMTTRPCRRQPGGILRARILDSRPAVGRVVCGVAGQNSRVTELHPPLEQGQPCKYLCEARVAVGTQRLKLPAHAREHVLQLGQARLRCWLDKHGRTAWRMRGHHVRHHQRRLCRLLVCWRHPERRAGRRRRIARLRWPGCRQLKAVAQYRELVTLLSIKLSVRNRGRTKAVVDAEA
eukprot:scaffold1112_cov116-Isochrysis_galbana.AAC.37